jgi:hypothetical protein
VHYPIIRRLVYWVFNGVSVASLVVFVLILDMWLHSYGEVGRWQINPRRCLSLTMGKSSWPTFRREVPPIGGRPDGAAGFSAA